MDAMDAHDAGIEVGGGLKDVGDSISCVDVVVVIARLCGELFDGPVTG